MNRRRTLSLVSLLLALSALTAGCGGADDGSDGADPADTTSQEPTSTAPTTPSRTTTPSPDEESTTPDPTPSESSGEASTPTPEEPDSDVSEPPTTYAEAEAHFAEATGEMREIKRFATPSGNIYCVLDDQFLPAGCELGEGAISDPAYCGTESPSQAIGRIELVDGAADPVCNSDTIREPGAPTLAYGDVAYSSREQVACLSEEIGVSCLDAANGQGFFLAKGRYEVFSQR